MCPTQDSAFIVLRLLSSTYRTAHIFAAGSDKSLCGLRRTGKAWQVAQMREKHIGSLPYCCITCWGRYHTLNDPEMRAFREKFDAEARGEPIT